MLKTYKQLNEEREAVLDEIESYKQGNTYITRIGLWNNSDYLSELSYIKRKIESEMTSYYIIDLVKIYKQLLTMLPLEIIINISSFGTTENQIAIQMIESNKENII